MNMRAMKRRACAATVARHLKYPMDVVTETNMAELLNMTVDELRALEAPPPYIFSRDGERLYTMATVYHWVDNFYEKGYYAGEDCEDEDCGPEPAMAA